MADPAPNTPKRTHKTARPSLTAREVRFCAGMADHGIITRAHTEAGFESASENAHTVAGRLLLRKPQIRRYIRQLQQEASDAAQVTVNRIYQALAHIAFANRLEMLDRHGCVLPKDQWPADVAATVEGIETEEVFEVVSEKGQPKRKELRATIRKVRTAKRTEALKLLAQILRMIGQDADAGKPPPAPLVIGGEADVNAL